MITVYAFNGRTFFCFAFSLYYIVSLHQTTTNYNCIHSILELYYIVSLHQTTTSIRSLCSFFCCIISSLYIKPQRKALQGGRGSCCIISSLYIKPQPNAIICIKVVVVLYRLSTSNHNLQARLDNVVELCYIVSLHQTTTLGGKLAIRQ